MSGYYLHGNCVAFFCRKNYVHLMANLVLVEAGGRIPSQQTHKNTVQKKGLRMTEAVCKSSSHELHVSHSCHRLLEHKLSHLYESTGPAPWNPGFCMYPFGLGSQQL